MFTWSLLSSVAINVNVAHPDKSGLIIVGTDKYKAKIERELQKDPIYLTHFKLETTGSEVYLGQSIKSILFQMGSFVAFLA